MLELYCAWQGWTFEVLSDLGSGMNYYKRGLKRLLDDIEAGRKYMKVYKQMKMYNDPATNPVLYAKNNK